jgi:Uma2 family endonuclease
MNAIALSPPISPPTLDVIPNLWTPVTWEEFLQISVNPDYEKAKLYYHQGRYYLEMGVGSDRAFDNTVIIILLSMFCIAKNIPIKGLTNCSYRKKGVRECQPDISYYIGDRLDQAPKGSSIVDLDLVPPPNLAIEIASSSLDLDLGAKRLLYEEIGVTEYWVVDVQNIKITAFRIHGNLGSDRITESQVMPNLRLSLIEEALQRSRGEDNSQVGIWFMNEMQSL